MSMQVVDLCFRLLFLCELSHWRLEAFSFRTQSMPPLFHLLAHRLLSLFLRSLLLLNRLIPCSRGYCFTVVGMNWLSCSFLNTVLSNTQCNQGIQMWYLCCLHRYWYRYLWHCCQLQLIFLSDNCYSVLSSKWCKFTGMVSICSCLLPIRIHHHTSNKSIQVQRASSLDINRQSVFYCL